MQKIRVLLVDDDTEDQRLVKLALRQATLQLSFEIASATNLAQATELLKNGDYELVILDLGLPDSKGLDTVCEVCKANSEVAIVVLTGLTDEETGLEAIRNGAADYLVKGQALEYTLVRAIRYAMERKRIETSLKQSSQKQQELLKEVENANKELKDFAYVISHDLKAPLRGIQTLTGWVVSDYSDKLDDSGREKLALLTQRVERMRNLIDGVLQYSRVGRVTEQRQEVDLNKLIKEAVDGLAPPKNITIEMENSLPQLLCEPTRMFQVFQNLLSNAVKYMDKPQGRIKVGCNEEDGCWKFHVTDNGPGIEEQDFERIFQIFQTLKPKDEYESTGVGLTVVKKAVELWGGRVWIESRAGLGSTFYFTVPIRTAEQIQPSPVEQTA